MKTFQHKERCDSHTYVGGKNEREEEGTALLIRCPIRKSEEAEVKHIFLLIS